jgi:hypothetical protein
MILSEGRKEDIYNKYKNKIEVERKLNSLIEPISLYDILIDEPYIQQTNYKFLEPIIQQYYVFNEIYPREGKELEELEPNRVATARDTISYKRQFIENLIPKLQFFERNKDKYPKKDFKQYVGLNFDRDFLDFTDNLMEEKEKKNEGKTARKNVDKIYEDNKVLIVSPKTHQASCFYGAGTRWCVTMKGQPAYFNQYTTGKKLYFVILKGMSQDNPFYKIAINVKFNEKVRNADFYDSKDRMMSNQEKELFMTIAPDEAIAKIQEDLDLSSPNIIKILAKEIDSLTDLSFTRRIQSENYTFKFTFSDFETANDIGDMSDMEEWEYENFQRFNFLVDIRLLKYTLHKKALYQTAINLTYNGADFQGLADGTMYYDSDTNSLRVVIGLEEHDGPNFNSFTYSSTYKVDENFQFKQVINNFDKYISHAYGQHLLKIGKFDEIDRDLRGVPEKPEKFGGPGYTFTRKGALVTKLFDILDALPEGKTITKREFFDKSETIKFTPEGNFNRRGERVKPGAFLSSWFAALASAKIIQYEGRKGFKKGPRYEEFKKKILGTKK